MGSCMLKNSLDFGESIGVVERSSRSRLFDSVVVLPIPIFIGTVNLIISESLRSVGTDIRCKRRSGRNYATLGVIR